MYLTKIFQTFKSISWSVRLEMLRLIICKRNLAVTYKDETGVWHAYDFENEEIKNEVL